jgi:aminopeptidase N
MFNLRWLVLACCCVITAAAQPVFPVRDKGEAPNRTYDVLHYRIEVSFDEPQKRVIGKVTTTLVPFLSSCTAIDFDAEEMQIRSVRLRDRDLRFTTTPTKLVVALDRAYSFRDTITVSIEYTCTPRRGLYFVQPDSAYPDTPRQIWTQGEDMDSHFWFPCYDFPNDKATTEVLVTVRSSFVALSNGELVGVREDARKGTKTYHWRENRPHVTYLVMLAIGEYAVLNDREGNLPLQYYVYPHHVADAKVCFAQTPDMIRFFNEKIGFAYPWEKYAQVLIKDFVAGGMENTSATSLMDDITVFDARARLDNSAVSLIAHELAHQWWGDVVTCKDWRHLWLNESFASYFDPLYHEYLMGRDEFDYQMYGAQQQGIDVDRRLGRKPIVSIGSYGENIYPRGASVLHMLRFVLGEELFWRAIRHYITTYQFQSVETHDFQDAIEEATGQNLFWFFDQWVYKAGYPVFDVSSRWNDSSKTLSLRVAQTQLMDSLTGVFRTPVDIELVTPAGSVTQRVNIMSADTVFSLPVSGPPDLVIFDKGNWLLKEVRYDRSGREWLYQAEHATNPVDRVRAVQRLAELQDSLSVVVLLQHIAISDPFWGVREEAVRALGKLRSTDTGVRSGIVQVLGVAARDSRSSVRAAALSQLARFPGSEAAGILRAALGDSSYAVIAASLRSLAKADSAHALPVLTAHLSVPSQGNIIANAALGSLPAVDSVRAMALAAEKVRYGQPLSTRFTAMGILGRYARTHAELLPTLVALGSDRNPSIRSSALRALGEAGNESVLPLLDSVAANPADRASVVARESAQKIRSRAGGQ